MTQVVTNTRPSPRPSDDSGNWSVSDLCRRYGVCRDTFYEWRQRRGSIGAGGLTRLSAWWLKLGIEPHFIHPAAPQENGRHERMHRTLKAQTSHPPAANADAQQIRFDAFRRHYNEQRPHQGLGQRPPHEIYTPSQHAMPDRVEEPW